MGFFLLTSNNNLQLDSSKHPGIRLQNLTCNMEKLHKSISSTLKLIYFFSWTCPSKTEQIELDRGKTSSRFKILCIIDPYPNHLSNGTLESIIYDQVIKVHFRCANYLLMFNINDYIRNGYFVDPMDREIHIENAENLWMRPKCKLRHQSRTSHERLPSHLHEFVFRNKFHNQDMFVAFLKIIRENYPICKNDQLGLHRCSLFHFFEFNKCSFGIIALLTFLIKSFTLNIGK